MRKQNCYSMNLNIWEFVNRNLIASTHSWVIWYGHVDINNSIDNNFFSVDILSKGRRTMMGEVVVKKEFIVSYYAKSKFVLSKRIYGNRYIPGRNFSTSKKGSMIRKHQIRECYQETHYGLTKREKSLSFQFSASCGKYTFGCSSPTFVLSHLKPMTK